MSDLEDPNHLFKALGSQWLGSLWKLRRELIANGLDHGPLSIESALKKRGAIAVPSSSTIWRLLVNAGEITPQPRKKPKTAIRRFEAAAPNEMWQIDFTEWALADKTIAYIFNIVDDHSRLSPASKVAPKATSRAAWESFSGAAFKWGLPSNCLSDNGVAFSGKIRHFEVHFEKQLRAAGIKPITSRPYHPQTCGKVERFQQTLKKWLRARPPAETVEELQSQIDEFLQFYNYERDHQGIGRKTPFSRWSATKAATTGSVSPEPEQFHHQVKCSSGRVQVGRRWHIGVGAEYSGKQADVIIQGLQAMVFVEGTLVRALTLDPSRKFQRSGLSPGRRTRKVS